MRSKVGHLVKIKGLQSGRLAQVCIEQIPYLKEGAKFW